jgi:hypothetical protein
LRLAGCCFGLLHPDDGSKSSDISVTYRITQRHFFNSLHSPVMRTSNLSPFYMKVISICS